jgi:hypothetical protein
MVCGLLYLKSHRASPRPARSVAAPINLSTCGRSSLDGSPRRPVTTPAKVKSPRTIKPIAVPAATAAFRRDLLSFTGLAWARL